MTRKMLINAIQSEETRIAVIDDKQLNYLDVASSSRQQKKGNVYKATISRIEQSLNAVFVSYGSKRHGFLPIKEIAPEYFHKPKNMKDPLSLKDVLKEGQELIIQIQKEERGNKGAAVTTYVSLAGTYVVLMPNNDRAGGVSRRIDGPDRSALKSALSQLTIPGDYGIIIRTAGLGRGQNELQWDLNLLVNLWHAILEASKKEKAPKLIYQETDIILRAVRDYLHDEIAEIIIDEPKAYELLVEHVQRYRPDYVDRLRLYENDTPLFSHYQIEDQIELAYQREINLPSGGAIVIDHTEALTSVDVNSAKATKGGDIEETALKTNVEAAREVARQLRIRDLGGLVVVDFIDMSSTANKRQVEKIMVQAIKQDKARVQVGAISSFGLLEMSRQRIRPSLEETSHHVCPRCNGKGAIRSIESLGVLIVRHVREAVLLPDTEEIQLQLPIELSSFLLNEKRDTIMQIEEAAKVRVVLIPNPYMETPEYKLVRVKAKDEQGMTSSRSYTLIDKPTEAVQPQKKARHEQPVITSLPNVEPSPTKRPIGLFRKLYESLFVGESAPQKKPGQRKASSAPNKRQDDQRRKQGKSQQSRHSSGQHTSQNRSQQQRSEQARRQHPKTQKAQVAGKSTTKERSTLTSTDMKDMAAKAPVSSGKHTKSASYSKQGEKRPQEKTPAPKKVPPSSKDKVMDVKAAKHKEKPKVNENRKSTQGAQEKAGQAKKVAKSMPSKQAKQPSRDMVKDVLARTEKSSTANASQVETAVSKPASAQSPLTQQKVERVVETTKPKVPVKKAASPVEKSVAIETSSKMSAGVQQGNLTLEVAVIGGENSPVKKVKQSASTLTKNDADTKPKAIKKRTTKAKATKNVASKASIKPDAEANLSSPNTTKMGEGGK